MSKKWLFLIISAPLLAGLIPVHAQDESCLRSKPAQRSASGAMALVEAKQMCSLMWVGTGVVLKAGATPDAKTPGSTVVRNSQGQLISMNSPDQPGVISIWSPKGEYVESFGGQGPNEGQFSARGGLAAWIDSTDKLHIRDGGPNWYTFTPDHKQISKVSGANLSYSAVSSAIFDDGSALTTTLSSDPANNFHVISPSGEVARAFGPIPRDMLDARVDTKRRIAYAGGNTFWALPYDGAASGLGYRFKQDTDRKSTVEIVQARLVR